jgi:PAS domain S-box-containing protein
MKRKLIRGASVVVMIVLVALIVWQGSFTFGEYAPQSAEQTFLFWAVSTLVFLLTVTIGFMLFRTAVKLYIERQANKEGSRIKMKLVAGALALSFVPVIFLVVFDIHVLNRNIEKWFTRPARNIEASLVDIARGIERESRDRVAALAKWAASLPEVRSFAADSALGTAAAAHICADAGIDEVIFERSGSTPVRICGDTAGSAAIEARVHLPEGSLLVRDRVAVDLAAKEHEIRAEIAEYNQLATAKKEFRSFYRELLALISLFILFFATWLGLFFARQISVPIVALLEAAREVRRGDLATRVRVQAIDELAELVRGFNEMTQDLEANARELERRRRFTEAILESIPTGVISLAADGKIQRVNAALSRILPAERVAQATRLDDLFSPEDAAEIRYLLKRARRTGQASRQLDLNTGGQILHSSITVAALEARVTSGFVMVLEDTSELLRAQKAAAWHEVARRIAHEIKNPLTPITLSADRIARHLDKTALPPEFSRIAREATTTISREVESVKTLVDEFSRFARFPAAQLAPANLNEVIEDALAVFNGRLDGIDIHTELASSLPPVNLDPEQFKRVIVNLVDNAAEAMQESLSKHLFIGTQAGGDAVELVIADTGCGISQADREKLFLPYFSTKGRGTGLGLAIVHHILSEHNAQIRVEDNYPVGARFIVEIPAATAAEAEPRPAETRV